MEKGFVSSYSDRDFTTVGHENLLELHDARVGADVVHRLSLLGLGDVIVIVKDVVEGQRLLNSRHGRDWLWRR
jgi:hypothetical protein